MYRFFDLSDEEAEQLRMCGICDEPLGVGRVNFGAEYVDMDVSIYQKCNRFDFVLSFDTDEIADFIRECTAPMLFYDSICNILCIFDDADATDCEGSMNRLFSGFTESQPSNI